MAHIRQQLRTKVQSLLSTALGVLVFVDRTHIIQTAELPCAIITTDNETVERLSVSRSLNREVQLDVRLYARSFEDLDNDLDDMAVIVENTLENDTTINAQAINLLGTNIDIADGDQQIGVATLTYNVRFLSITDPETII